MSEQLVYAGIGGRDTPADILEIMMGIGASLAMRGWILRSGHCTGPDQAFEAGADMVNPLLKEIYLPWKGFAGSSSELHPGNHPYTPEERYIAEKMHPAWHKLKPAAQKLHTRNVRQISGLDITDDLAKSKFVVCWTEKGFMKGGTSQALRIAENLHIPIFNFGKEDPNQLIQELYRLVDAYQPKRTAA